MPAIRAVAQIVFGTVRINPADVERLQRIAGDQNSRLALGLRRRRGHPDRCTAPRRALQRLSRAMRLRTASLQKPAARDIGSAERATYCAVEA